jgi:uncharacterized repeat protein (TIGR02543 family)
MQTFTLTVSTTPVISGTVILVINPATGEVTASATGGNTGSVGALTFTWSGGATGTGRVKTPILGTYTTCSVTAKGASSGIFAAVTVYKTVVSLFGKVGVDEAKIANAYGKEGDIINIDYVVGTSGKATNSVAFSGGTVVNDGTSPATYKILATDATSGVITIIATFIHTDISKYTVSFAGEEIDIEPQTIEEGGLVIRPEDPERENYNFNGWFTDNITFTNEWDFENDVVTQDITLYAKWGKISGITEIESAGLKIYPNPVKEELNIECGELKIIRVEIIDLSGKYVSTFDFQLSSKSVNVSSLPQGIYFVKVVTDKGNIMRKLIKE